jgi:hypothetical protein
VELNLNEAAPKLMQALDLPQIVTAAKAAVAHFVTPMSKDHGARVLNI